MRSRHAAALHFRVYRKSSGSTGDEWSLVAGEGSERQTRKRSKDVVVTKLPGALYHGGRLEAPRIDPHVKGAGSYGRARSLGSSEPSIVIDVRRRQPCPSIGACRRLLSMLHVSFSCHSPKHATTNTLPLCIARGRFLSVVVPGRKRCERGRHARLAAAASPA
jgi:hypothetical protein